MVFLSDMADYASGMFPGAPPIYLHEGPPSPDDLTVFGEYPGAPPDPTHDDRLAISRHRFQVLCRGADYEPVRARAETLYRLFGRTTNLVINGNRYLQITAIQAPFGLPRDENSRVQVAFNCEAEAAT